MAMHDNPRHWAWTGVPVAITAVWAVAFLIALWDFTAHGSQDAAVGLVLVPLGAAAWTWTYREIRRDS